MKKSGKNLSSGGRLRAARTILGFDSQAAFGEALGGFSQDQVSRAERGAGGIPDAMLRALSRDHNISPDWVLTGEGSMFKGQVATGAPEDLEAGRAEASPVVGPANARVLDRVLAAHERLIDALAGRGRPPWAAAEIAEPGYVEVGAEGLEGRSDLYETHVPIIDAVAAGAAREAGQADAYPPGWAESFVEFPGAPPGAFAVRVAGASMEPDFRDGDLVIVDPRRRAEGAGGGEPAVVVYEDPATGCRLGRLKVFRRRGRRAVLASRNPAYPEVELETKAVLAAYRIMRHLPRVRRRSTGT